MTIEERRQFEEKYKQDFINDFRNTALAPYSEAIYDWYSTTKMPLLYKVALEEDKSTIQDLIRHCHDLIIILGDLRNGVVRWGHEEINDLPVPVEIEHTIQNYLTSYINEAQYLVGTSSSSEPKVVEAIRIRWGSALAWMPLISGFEYDDDGRFTQDTFDDAYERIQKCFEESQHLFEVSTELLMHEFLKFVKELDVEMNNKTYAQVYRCLERFGWLPNGVVDSHNKTTTKYIRESYIKSRFKNLKDGDFSWREFLTDPIELDFLDL